MEKPFKLSVHWIFACLFFAACAQPVIQTQNLNLKPQKQVLLLHGSHLDASVWDQVISELSYPFHVEALSLLGRDKNESATLKEMAQDICSKINQPTVIVAHSFSGVVANQMVGLCPDKIQQIVYLAALVPLNGEKPFASVSKPEEKAYAKVVQFKKDRIYPKAASQFFPAMDAGLSKRKVPKKLKLFSESYAAGSLPLEFDTGAFDKIPKAYIYTEKDSVITLETQKKFTTRTAMEKTATLASGHLPMLSQPQLLISALREVITP